MPQPIFMLIKVVSQGRISLSSKFLPDNTVETTNLMFDILQNTDLEDKKRITELMFQNFMGFQQSIVENGHRFAMLGQHRCTINFLMFKKKYGWA